MLYNVTQGGMPVIGTLKNLISRMLVMCEPAYMLLRGAMLLSCALLFCSLMILISIGQPTYHTYELYLCAKEMSTAPAALLLLASIGTVCIEEHSVR